MHIENKYKSTLIVNNKFNHGTNPLQAILDTLPPEPEALSPSDTLNIFRQLCETSQKLSQTSASFNVFDHENFAILRQAIKVSLPYLKTNETFEVLKAIDSLSIFGNDEIFDVICSYLLNIVYNMSLNEIMVFDIVLASRQQNKMARELRRNLIDRFNVKASQMPVEFNFYVKLSRMLRFIERNRSHIIDEVYINMRNCAAKQQIDIFTASEAMDVIISLSNFDDQCEYFQAILDKSFNVWSSSNVNIGMIETVLTFLAKRKSTLTHDLFNDTRFIEKCARVAIDDDLKKCFSIQRYFNRLSFSSKQLIDHLLNHLNDDRIKDDFIYNSITVCVGCDIANYKPQQFDDILVPRLSSLNFHHQFDLRLNWPKFALRLHRLGTYHKPLVEAILEEKSHFESFGADNIEALEILQMENILNIPVGRSLLHLQNIAGVDSLRLLIRAENDAIIPLLVKMNIHSKHFVQFEESERDSFSSIQCDDNQCLYV